MGLIKKIALCGSIGFLIPLVFLLPLEFAFAEISRLSDFETVVNYVLVPCCGCGVYFVLAAFASFLPKNGVSLVRALTIIGLAFIATGMFTLTGPHNKSEPQPSWIRSMSPLLAPCVAFVALIAFGNSRRGTTVQTSPTDEPTLIENITEQITG